MSYPARRELLLYNQPVSPANSFPAPSITDTHTYKYIFIYFVSLFTPLGAHGDSQLTNLLTTKTRKDGERLPMPSTVLSDLDQVTHLESSQLVEVQDDRVARGHHLEDDCRHPKEEAEKRRPAAVQL